MLVDDFATYGFPALPNMSGGAGTKITDAVFGQDILRISDGSTHGAGSDILPTYSTVSAFNYDSTKIFAYARNDSTPYIATFNPVAFSCGLLVEVPGRPAGIQSFWPVWSYLDADKLWFHNDLALYSYKVSTQAWTLVKDFSASLSGKQLRQMQVSADDDIFTWRKDTSGGARDGCIAYKLSTDTIVYTSNDPDVDETRVSKTGRYLMLGTTTRSNASIVDLQNGNAIQTPGSGYDWYHNDMGTTLMVHDGEFGGERTVWSVDFAGFMANGTTHTRLLAGKGSSYWPQGYNRSHVSMRADTDEWGTWSRYADDGSSPATWGDSEIIRVKLDGTDHIQRICHHRSDHTGGDNYNAQPHASSNREGTYIAFGSNWGVAGGRIDLYVVNAPSLLIPGVSNSGSTSNSKFSQRAYRSRRSGIGW